MNSHAAVTLETMLGSVSDSLNPDAARALVNLRAGDAAQFRIAELAEKCNEGALTEDERAGYETYVSAADFIAILQAQARRKHGVR